MKWKNRVALAVIAMAALATAGSAQVMQHVPADAQAVAKVSNLKGLSDKIAGLAQRFGIAAFFPPLVDPLTSIESDLHITQGINPTGDAAIVMVDEDKYGHDAKNYGVILLPVSDYKAFLGNFSRPTEAGDKPAPDNATAPAKAAPTPDAQGISAIAFPNAFDSAYVAQWGNYAAISKVKSLLATPGTGLTPSGLAAKEVNNKDFVVFINMPAVKAKAIASLQANRQKMIDDMNKAMARNHGNQAMGPMLTVFVGAMIDNGQRLLEDAQAATYGISIDNTGIRTTILGEFIPDSPIGKQVNELKNSSDSLLANLPQDKYMMYGGVAWDSQQAATIFDKVATPIRQQAAQQGDSGQLITKALDAYRKAIVSTQAQTGGWIAPSGMMGQGGIFKLITIMTGDAAAMIEAQHAMLDMQGEFLKTSNDPNLKMTTTYTANAKQLDGVSFNEFKVQLDTANDNSMQARQMAQGMRMMYGPEGLMGYTATVDSKHLLTGMGAGDDALTHAVDAIKAGQDPMGTSASLKDVNANLPTQRLGVFYIPLDQIAKTGASYARQFGAPINLQLPPDMAPIGATVGTEQSAIRLDSYIPTQTVQSLIAAGMQAYMAAQGGGGGGL